MSFKNHQGDYETYMAQYMADFPQYMNTHAQGAQGGGRFVPSWSLHFLDVFTDCQILSQP